MPASEYNSNHEGAHNRPLPPSPYAASGNNALQRLNTISTRPSSDHGRSSQPETDTQSVDESDTRTRMPEGLRRSQYLTSTINEKTPIKSKKKGPNYWVITSWILTWWAPPFMLRVFGLRDKQTQQAWREKVSLVQIIVMLCGAVGFLTFGFNAAVCGRQTNRIRPAGVTANQVIIAGRVFDLKSFKHPTPHFNIPGSGDLQELGIGGRDLSFMFQTVNYNCKSILKPLEQDDDKGNVLNYFPCVTIDREKPQINGTDNPERKGCHISAKARKALHRLEIIGDVYYNWTDIQKPGTSLVAFNGQVVVWS